MIRFHTTTALRLTVAGLAPAKVAGGTTTASDWPANSKATYLGQNSALAQDLHPGQLAVRASNLTRNVRSLSFKARPRSAYRGRT